MPQQISESSCSFVPRVADVAVENDSTAGIKSRVDLLEGNVFRRFCHPIFCHRSIAPAKGSAIIVCDTANVRYETGRQ